MPEPAPDIDKADAKPYRIRPEGDTKMTKTTDAIRYAIDADMTVPHVLGVGDGDDAWSLAVAHDDPEACDGLDRFLGVNYLPSNTPE